MLNKMFLLSSALIVAICALCANAARAQGKDCSQVVVNRSYSQTFQGFLNVPAYFAALGVPAPPGVGIVPNAGSGVLTFLPQGKMTGRITLAIGLLGLLPDLELDSSSTYSLSLDTSKDPGVCAGDVTVSAPGIPGGGPLHFQLLVGAGGQQVEMIHTDTGLILALTGVPIQTSGCSNMSIRGKYTYSIKGWGLAPPSGPMSFPPEQLLAGYFPFAFSGAMEFSPRASELVGAPEGAASVAGWDTVTLNGQIMPRVYDGWYKVKHDCTGTLVLHDQASNTDFHLELLVGKGGQMLHLVNVDTLPETTTPTFVMSAILTRVNTGR